MTFNNNLKKLFINIALIKRLYKFNLYLVRKKQLIIFRRHIYKKLI